MEESRAVYVSPEVEISNADLVSARVRKDEGFDWIIIELNNDAARRFAKLTSAEINFPSETAQQRLAVMINGEVLIAPIITAPMTNGIVPLHGSWSNDRAHQIARGIVSE